MNTIVLKVPWPSWKQCINDNFMALCPGHPSGFCNMFNTTPLHFSLTPSLLYHLNTWHVLPLIIQWLTDCSLNWSALKAWPAVLVKFNLKVLKCNNNCKVTLINISLEYDLLLLLQHGNGSRWSLDNLSHGLPILVLWWTISITQNRVYVARTFWQYL